MTPTETREIQPSPCSCGCRKFKNLEPYYTHQHIELPEIVMTVIHFILYRGECTKCGKDSKGYIPKEFAGGFGARFSAHVAEIGGIDAIAGILSRLSVPPCLVFTLALAESKRSLTGLLLRLNRITN